VSPNEGQSFKRLSTQHSALSTEPLGTGKLPPELLRGLVLGRLGARRTETIVGATLGVDAAAVAIDADWACVLTTDPITTATSGAGRLAVHVVCNDLAAMGAEPLGLLATLLFPAGVTPATIEALSVEIDATARELNVEVLGGHTEVAPGLTAPLVVMSGVGTARRDRLLTAAGARPGDAVVLTKAAGLEGSHILANDLANRLGHLPPEVLEEARGYAAELSVVPEARLAVEFGATAMHDPTEGGVVGAAWEMAEASGCGFRIHVDRIVVRDATRLICDALGVDPLRLIASGALLVACHDGTAMVDGLRQKGLEAAVIGEFAVGERQLIHPNGHTEVVDHLDRDELYRVLEAFAASAG
jgi:hydrogenase expression/formation protein HypE